MSMLVSIPTNIPSLLWKYIECETCGKMVKQQGNKPKKYCNKCAKKIKQDMNRENMKKYRNVVK